MFADPDRFDITRRPNRHTAFRLGAFYCLGAALARTETDECFRALLDRSPVPPLGHRLDSPAVEF